MIVERLKMPRPRKIPLRDYRIPAGSSEKSPVTTYLRSLGKTAPEGVNRQQLQARARQVGQRFLRSIWHKEAMQRENSGKELRYPLPTEKQMIHGGRLPKEDFQNIIGQLSFAGNVFVRGKTPAEKARIMEKLTRLIAGKQGRMLGIKSNLTAFSSKRQAQLTQGADLYDYFRGNWGFATKRDQGSIVSGLVHDKTGKAFFAKGFSRDPAERTVPLHEAIHTLQQYGVIKADIPFAQAAQKLYALEKGFVKPSQKLKPLSLKEFDRKPQPDPARPGISLEPLWSYSVGDKIGEWIFQNLPANKRWDYIYKRCMGETHSQAMQTLA